MIKKINNSKIRVDNIFRLPPSSKSRIGNIRLDKNERADPHLNFFLNKLKKTFQVT